MFDIFSVFSNLSLYPNSLHIFLFVYSLYIVDIIDVERKGVLKFIRHLKGHIFILIFVNDNLLKLTIPLFLGVHHLLHIRWFCLVYCN